MPRIRSRFQNLSPAQKEAQRKLRLARSRVEIIACGIGDRFRNLCDREDLAMLSDLIEHDLAPALDRQEDREKEYGAAAKPRRKPSKKGPKAA